MLGLEGIKHTQGSFVLRADWQIAPGARVALVGPSGAGKSTLLSLIGGYATPQSGIVRLNGADITRDNPETRDMATLFQDGNLFPGLTLAQNVGLGLRPALRLTTAEQDNVRAALDRVGLAKFADQKPGEVSGGQQSRTALARVLLQRKRWLLLDEPFAALGPALRTEMLQLVASVLDDSGAGLLMVTHDPQDAKRIADHLVFVDDGRACAPKPLADAFANPPPALAAYLGTT